MKMDHIIQSEVSQKEKHQYSILTYQPIIQSEVSQKEKTPIQYTNAYIWNLERW